MEDWSELIRLRPHIINLQSSIINQNQPPGTGPTDRAKLLKRVVEPLNDM